MRVLWRQSARTSRRSHARPGRTGRPSTGRRGTDDRMPQPEWMRNAECRDGAGCPPRTWQEKPAGMDGLHGQETAQDPSGLPALPRRRPRQPCHHRGIDHRRATYSETGPCGSEEGRAEKGSQQGIPRRAAYPIPHSIGSAVPTLRTNLSQAGFHGLRFPLSHTGPTVGPVSTRDGASCPHRPSGIHRSWMPIAGGFLLFDAGSHEDPSS
jgi:hypothetical protein